MINQVIKQKMYRVEYRYLHTGFTSHGDWLATKELAKIWVDYGNKQYNKSIIHWIGES